MIIMIWSEILLIIAYIDGPGYVDCREIIYVFDFWKWISSSPHTFHYADGWSRWKRKLRRISTASCFLSASSNIFLVVVEYSWDDRNVLLFLLLLLEEYYLLPLTRYGLKNRKTEGIVYTAFAYLEPPSIHSMAKHNGFSEKLQELVVFSPKTRMLFESSTLWDREESTGCEYLQWRTLYRALVPIYAYHAIDRLNYVYQRNFRHEHNWTMTTTEFRW